MYVLKLFFDNVLLLLDCLYTRVIVLFFKCFLYVFLNLLLRLPLCLLGLLGLWRTTQLPSQLSLLLGGFYVYEKKDQKDGVPFRRSTGFIPDTLNSTNSNNITSSRCIYHEKDSGSNQIYLSDIVNINYYYTHSLWKCRTRVFLYLFCIFSSLHCRKIKKKSS